MKLKQLLSESKGTWPEWSSKGKGFPKGSIVWIAPLHTDKGTYEYDFNAQKDWLKKPVKVKLVNHFFYHFALEQPIDVIYKGKKRWVRGQQVTGIAE